MKTFALFSFCLVVIWGCNSNPQSAGKLNDSIAQHPIDTPQIISPSDSIAHFGQRLYINIAEIHSGEAFTDNNGENVNYRIVVIPQEENMMLMAEKIAIGDAEGEMNQFRKLSNINDGIALPEFGYYLSQSVKFVDSVTISVVFDRKRKVVNLQNLKSFKPASR